MRSQPFITGTIFSGALLLTLMPADSFAQKAPVKRPAVPAAGAPQQLIKTPLTRLTAEDVQLIVSDQAQDNPRVLASLAADPEQRKTILNNLRQALSVASEARATGFAEQPEIKIELDLAEIQVLAGAYNDKLKEGGAPLQEGAAFFAYIDSKAADAFFALPKNKAKYDIERETFLKFALDRQRKDNPAAEITAEQKQTLSPQWEIVAFGAAKAKELNLINRDVLLNCRLERSLLLARSYTQAKLLGRVTPTEAEIWALMESDPRFSAKAEKARAEEILAKARGGADFAALANEYTEDPGNTDPATGKGNGGLYDWSDRARYVPEFSDGAWTLNEGGISGLVKTQFGYHILKLEGKRTVKDADGSERQEVKVRHILISTMFNDESNVQGPAAPITLHDAAKNQVAEAKQKLVMDEIALRNPISVPDDFPVDAAPKATVTKSAGATKKTPVPVKKRTVRKRT